MPIALVEATHVRVTCDACKVATAELCAKRELPVVARAQAVPKFRAAGWHHDPGSYVRAKTEEAQARDGAGKWYCPACARQTHL